MFGPSNYIALSLIATCWTLQVASGASTLRKPKELPAGLNCTDHVQTIDKCSSSATYSYTTSTNPYPLNAEEMKISCDRIGEGLKCLKLHGKCLSSVARRSLISYSGSRSRHSKKLCANLTDPKALDFLKSAECIRSKNKGAIMIANERELISTIQMLATNSSMKWDDRFHQACCSANYYKAKVMRDIEPECSKYKLPIDEMLNSMIGDLLESACPDEVRLNAICAKLPKPILAKDWKAVSLTGAALDLIVALSDNPKN